MQQRATEMFEKIRTIQPIRFLPEALLLFGIVVGIHIIFALPVIVNFSLSIVPAVVPQTFLFRAIAEIIFAFYILLLLLNRSYLPRFSLVVLSVLVFTAILGVSTWTSINPSRSFWGTAWRPEGYILFLHLFLFFIVLVGVFREKKDWIKLLRFICLVSIPLALVALTIKISNPGVTRIDTVFGGASHYGSYLTMIILLSFFGSLYEGGRKFKIFFLLIALTNISVLLFLNGTRGAWIGVGVAFGFLALSRLLLFSKGQEQKRKALLFGVCILLSAFLSILVLRGLDYIPENSFLERYGSLWRVFFEQRNLRFSLWDIGFTALKESPLYGYGLESFAYLYDKNYHVGLAQFPQYSFMKRAHNQFVDILVAGGVLGLAAYGAMFGSAISQMARYKGRALGLFATFALASVLLGHAVQNMFNFDTLHTYVLFFFILAFISVTFSSSTQTQGQQTLAVAKPQGSWRGGAKKAIGMVCLLILAGGVLFAINIRPLIPHIHLLQADRLFKEGKMREALHFIQKANQVPGYAEIEMHQFAAILIMNNHSQAQDPNLQKEFSQELERLTMSLERHLQEEQTTPRAFYYWSLGRIYRDLYLVEGNLEYLERGENILAKAIEFNPRYPEFFYLMGEIKFLQQQEQAGTRFFERAYELEGDVAHLYERIGVSLIDQGKNEEGIEQLQRSLRVSDFSVPGVIKRRVWLLAYAYKNMGEYEEIVDLYEGIVSHYPQLASEFSIDFHGELR